MGDPDDEAYGDEVGAYRDPNSDEERIADEFDHDEVGPLRRTPSDAGSELLFTPSVGSPATPPNTYSSDKPS